LPTSEPTAWNIFSPELRDPSVTLLQIWSQDFFLKCRISLGVAADAFVTTCLLFMCSQSVCLLLFLLLLLLIIIIMYDAMRHTMFCTRTC